MKSFLIFCVIFINFIANNSGFPVTGEGSSQIALEGNNYSEEYEELMEDTTSTQDYLANQIKFRRIITAPKVYSRPNCEVHQIEVRGRCRSLEFSEE